MEPEQQEVSPAPRSRSPSHSRSRSRSPRRLSRSPQRSRSPRRHSRSPHRSPSGKRIDFGSRANGKVCRVLGVFGLQYRVQAVDLMDLFSKYGRVEKADIVRNRFGESKGFGFVTFAEEGDATAAMSALNGTDFMGRAIRVDYSLTEQPHHPTPGRYMGPRDHRDDRRDYRYPPRDFDRHRGDYRSDRGEYRGDRGDYRGDRGDYRGDRRDDYYRRDDRRDDYYRGRDNDYRGDRRDDFYRPSERRGRDRSPAPKSPLR